VALMATNIWVFTVLHVEPVGVKAKKGLIHYSPNNRLLDPDLRPGEWLISYAIMKKNVPFVTIPCRRHIVRLAPAPWVLAAAKMRNCSRNKRIKRITVYLKTVMMLWVEKYTVYVSTARSDNLGFCLNCGNFFFFYIQVRSAASNSA
jgi:hypothetical protein